MDIRGSAWHPRFFLVPGPILGGGFQERQLSAGSSLHFPFSSGCHGCATTDSHLQVERPHSLPGRLTVVPSFGELQIGRPSPGVWEWTPGLWAAPGPGGVDLRVVTFFSSFFFLHLLNTRERCGGSLVLSVTAPGYCSSSWVVPRVAGFLIEMLTFATGSCS